MFLILANEIDISWSVAYNTIKITEQLNNRVDTCQFQTNEEKVDQWSSIEVFEYLKATKESTIWTKILFFDEDFETSQKYRVWEKMFINIRETEEFFWVIDSINFTTKEITLVENIPFTVPVWAKFWQIIFAWVVMKNPETEIRNSEVLLYKVTASDYSSAINRKVVVDTFDDQYVREILSRIFYKFVAQTFEADLDLFESPWTESWVARAMTANTDDKIQGNSSMQTGATAGWTATWTQTISSVDLTSADHFNLWFKFLEWEWSKVDSFKFRIWQDSSNYFEMSTPWIWTENEDAWSLYSFILASATQTGSPNIAGITWLQIEIEVNDSIPGTWILFDHNYAVWNGFTINETIRGSQKFSDVRVQYKKVTATIEELAKTQGNFWFMDYERNLHFFEKTWLTAPFSIDDTSENFWKLKITADITKLKNRQTVRWWIAPDQNRTEQIIVSDGEGESWRVDYPFKDMEIFVDTWGWDVQKTVWTENLVEATTVDYLSNFNEKTIRRWNDSKLNSWDKIRLSYFAYKDIRAQVSDITSISATKALLWGDGIVDGSVISDTWIRTFEDARARWQAELAAYSNAIITVTFETEVDWLSAWQLIHVTDTLRWTDDNFLIQKVTKRQKSEKDFTYSVSCASTMFWLTEFFQLLLKRSDKLLIDVSEIVDVVIALNEVLVITDGFIWTKKSNISTAWDLQLKKWDFIDQTWSQTSNWVIWSSDNFSNFYAEFIWSETWTIDFDPASNYNDLKALRIETEVWGTWKEAQTRFVYRIPIKSSTEYDLTAFLEILADFTNQWSAPGISMILSEYANKTGWSSLADTTLINWETNDQDFNKYTTTFTTNASANFINIIIKITDSIWIASISDIILKENWIDSQVNPWIASFSEAI